MTPYFDTRDASVGVGIIAPTLFADVRILACRADGKECRVCAPSALAAAYFIFFVRGLPLSEAEIETPRGIYTARRVRNDEKCELILHKCKQICSKSAHFCQKCEIIYTDVQTDVGAARLYKCDDADCVSDELLRELMLPADADFAKIAIAYSFSDGVSKTKSLSVDKNEINLDFLTAHAVASVLPFSAYVGEKIKIISGGNELYFRRERGSLAVSSRFLRPLVFNTPSAH